MAAPKSIQIGVIGAGSCSGKVGQTAFHVGKAIAREGAVLLCGGLGGVMEAAARGAKEEGGVTVGILPGALAEEANPYIDIPIVTQMGHARNVVLVRSSHAVIAVSGGYGTLSEIAIALKIGIPCIGIETWDQVDGVIMADSPDQAVLSAIEKIKEKNPP